MRPRGEGTHSAPPRQAPWSGPEQLWTLHRAGVAVTASRCPSVAPLRCGHPCSRRALGLGWGEGTVGTWGAPTPRLVWTRRRCVAPGRAWHLVIVWDPDGETQKRTCHSWDMAQSRTQTANTDCGQDPAQALMVREEQHHQGLPTPQFQFCFFKVPVSVMEVSSPSQPLQLQFPQENRGGAVGGTPGPMAIFLETSLYLLSPQNPNVTDRSCQRPGGGCQGLICWGFSWVGVGWSF